PNPPNSGKNCDDADYEVGTMEPSLQSIALIPLFAEDLTHISQAEAPWKRAKEGIDNESSHIHLCDTGWKGDKGPDYRQQPASEDDHLTISCEPPIREIQIVMGN